MRIKCDASIGRSPIVTAREVVENLFLPLAVRRNQLKNDAATAGATSHGCTVEISFGVEHRSCGSRFVSIERNEAVNNLLMPGSVRSPRKRKDNSTLVGAAEHGGAVNISFG